MATRRAGFLRLCFGQVRTPGDNLHVERSCVAGHTRAEATETHDAERFPGEPNAHRHATLEAAGAHSPIGNRHGAGGGDERAKRQFGRCVGRARAAAGRVANRNALTCASRDVQRGVRSACDADHAQFRELADQALGKGSALTHCQQNVEVR